jgi:hypothetical protein
MLAKNAIDSKQLNEYPPGELDFNPFQGRRVVFGYRKGDALHEPNTGAVPY